MTDAIGIFFTYNRNAAHSIPHIYINIPKHSPFLHYALKPHKWSAITPVNQDKCYS